MNGIAETARSEREEAHPGGGPDGQSPAPAESGSPPAPGEPGSAHVFGRDPTTAAERHCERFQELVELERQEEMARHEQEIRQLDGAERERRGRAILRLSGRDRGEGLGGHLVQFVREGRGEPLPETAIGVGDLVMISRDDPTRRDNPTGTVSEVTGYSVTVVLDQQPPDFVTGGELRLDLYVNDVTFRRMKDALDRLRRADARLAELRDVVTGAEAPAESEADHVEHWHDASLNESQRDAVRRALGADRFHLIHGPPGTGKTTTAVEVVRQHVDRGDRVLATAASNVAVDNVLEFLVTAGVSAVRVGHPARVTPLLREHTLDRVVEDHPDYRRSRELRQQAFDLKDRAEQELTRPSGRYRRGMSDEKIRRLAEQGRGSRGLPAAKIEEMAEFLGAREEIDALFDESRVLEDAAVEDVLESASVVCTTNSTAGSDLLRGFHFDVLVLDEATQATEPSCLIPAVRADKVVMAGDHRQLPPTVLSREAGSGGLDVTLFERLAGLHGERILDLLTVQYRMHRSIMDFPSRSFYGGRLRADAGVAGHTLWDLDPMPERVDPELWPVLDPSEPVVFVDTRDTEAAERSRRGSTSRENPREARAVVRLAAEFAGAGIRETDVGVIAPYADQVRRIRRTLDRDGIEVHTVDGFQGREKEVILLSFTRSNVAGELGFLRDRRRLNVALTRARRKLVIVGDASTLEEDEIFGALAEYIEEHGRRLPLGRLADA